MTDNKERERLAAAGHGYIVPRTDSGKARCGGPAVCPVCQAERAALAASQEKAEPVGYVGWYCAHCQHGVDASDVTYHEQHTVCGRVITHDRPPVAAQAGDSVHSFEEVPFAEFAACATGIAPVAAQASEPVAVLRFDRGTPGRENEMPHVVSCNRLPDGDYAVYLTPQPSSEAVRDAALEEALAIIEGVMRDQEISPDREAAAAMRAIRALKSAPHRAADELIAETHRAVEEYLAKRKAPQSAEQRKCKAGLYDDCNDDFGCVGCPEPKSAAQPSASTDSVAQDSIVQWARSAGIKGSRKDGSFTESDCARLADFALAARRGASPAALEAELIAALRWAIDEAHAQKLAGIAGPLSRILARAQGEQA